MKKSLKSTKKAFGEYAIMPCQTTLFKIQYIRKSVHKIENQTKLGEVALNNENGLKRKNVFGVKSQ